MFSWEPRDLSLPSFRGYKRNEQRAKQIIPRLMTDHFHWLCSMPVGCDVTACDLECRSSGEQRSAGASGAAAVLISVSSGYRMIRSARPNTLGGIVTPICFAVFKLTASSNFVACSIGNSAGLNPLMILST